MLWLLLIPLVLVVALVVYVHRVPLGPHPHYKFNALLPRLLNTGAVTCLGFCFVARHYITGPHRAHEMYHHRCVVEQGRWTHLFRYLWTLLEFLWRTRGAKYTASNGRTYWAAYWFHPEEMEARFSASQNPDTYPMLGTP